MAADSIADDNVKLAIAAHAAQLGAMRCGFAVAGRVDDSAIAMYDGWIAAGRHGQMDYCAKYRDQRNDPRLLLDGARTVIVCAFNYNSGRHPAGLVARYALGADYHHVVRQRMESLGAFITEHYGGVTRALVDTAPMRERYWARQAGVGRIGLNNQLIVEGAGSYFVLGELLWTGSVMPDVPVLEGCLDCGACVRACPTGALDGHGGCDASKCLSYLTIEAPYWQIAGLADGGDGAGTAGEGDGAGTAGGGAGVAGGGQRLRAITSIVGCDICQEACPYNAEAPLTGIAEFAPRQQMLQLTPDVVLAMGSAAYKRLVADSPLRRIPLKKLKLSASL